jgi:hypothetical protein
MVEFEISMHGPGVEISIATIHGPIPDLDVRRA